MPQDFTSTGLIAAVRRNAALGPPSTTFPTNTDLIAFLNEEMSNKIVTLLMRPREERFVAYYDFSTVADEDEYRIPYGSIWSDVRDVQSWIGERWTSIPQIQPELARTNSFSNNTGNPAFSYYLKDNQVVLVPRPASAGQPMRMKYFRRPGFVVTTGYSDVSAASGSGPTYTATVGTTTGMVAGLFDLLGDTFPYDPILMDIEGTIASGTTLTLTLTAAEYVILTAAVGDSLLVAAGDAPAPQIPQDLISLLEQYTTLRALVAKKDLEGAKAQSALCEQTKKVIVEAMSPRADGLGQRVVGRAFRGRGRFGGFPFGNSGGSVT